MALTVTITVQDKVPDPIVGATVEIFSAAGSLLTTLTTDGAGQVSTNLAGSTGQGTLYQARIYKLGTALFDPTILFAERRSFYVLEPLPAGFSNDFTLETNTYLPEASSDPNMCKINFKATRLDLAPLMGYTITINELRNPSVVYTAVIRHLLVGGYAYVTMGGDGKATLSLPRNGVYLVHIPDYMDSEFCMIVPDQNSALFSDLVFLWPKSITTDVTTLALAVGESKDITITDFLMSNERSQDAEGRDYPIMTYARVILTAGSDKVEITSVDQDTIRVTGRIAGAATLGFEMNDAPTSNLPITEPKPPIAYTPVAITVS